jgi:ketosteroid isomerase-like protein
MTSSAEAAKWLTEHVTTMTSGPMKSETAESRDLGYTWGTFAMTTADRKASTGYYLRVWTRKADGTWQVVADITEPGR